MSHPTHVASAANLSFFLQMILSDKRILFSGG